MHGKPPGASSTCSKCGGHTPQMMTNLVTKETRCMNCADGVLPPDVMEKLGALGFLGPQGQGGVKETEPCECPSCTLTKAMSELPSMIHDLQTPEASPGTPEPSGTGTQDERRSGSDMPQGTHPACSHEKDPHGMDPHQPGAKLDAEKVRAGLMIAGFSKSLLAVAEVTTYGAKKYTPMGWAQVPDGYLRYSEAMCRHMLNESAEELHDPDSKLLHAAHCAWNALARLEFLLKKYPNKKQSKP